MISDLQIQGGTASVVPHGTLAGDLVGRALDSIAPIQPVADVQTYLRQRRPQPTCDHEKCLLITLPAKIQDEVKAMVRACQFTLKLVVETKSPVIAACAAAVRVWHKWNWKVATFRGKFDLWREKQDWLVLVNRAKAPASWKSSNVGLSEEFLRYAEQRLASYGRHDAKRQAIFSLYRQWRTGKNDDGVAEVIPGYETGWAKRDRENHPPGWHYTNILREIKKRARYNRATRAWLHEGESAAREFLPHTLGTRKNLRFLEKVTFDDVRMDWLVFNTETGQAEELWLLVARDEATSMVLGFVMHPATVREDGKAAHLGARHMKELAAYLLERYPLPPYVVHWLVERGTATLAEAVNAALGELLNHRIIVRYTSMIGGQSPTGYAEKRKGNSRGKASHEAHNRLFHTQASRLTGQTGANWSIRPADLNARVDEAKECWALRQRLPEHKRGDVRFPLVVLQTEARQIIHEFCLEQNFRTDHQLEGFEPVLEWFDGTAWQPASTFAGAAGPAWRTRMERPVERAARLIRSVDRWDRVSPEIIRTFLEHTQRQVVVEANGEVRLMHQGRTLIFRHAGLPLAPGTKALAYHHSDDPQFLHLTSGDGCVLGTWVQRGRGAALDQEALAEAMRYTHAAREQVRAVATELAAPEISKLAAMRENNAALQEFVTVTEAPAATSKLGGNQVAAALQAIQAAGADLKVNPPPAVPVADCTEELLARAESAPKSQDNWE